MTLRTVQVFSRGRGLEGCVLVKILVYRRMTYRDGTPAAEATKQLVSCVEEFVGDLIIDAVDALKHAVTLTNNRMKLLTDEILNNVWLASS